MPTTIRTSEPRELLSLIPYQLGFRPEESAVLVSLRGERSRVGLVARVDLGDLGDPDHGPVMARSLVNHLVADGAHRCVLVLYTGRPPADVAGHVGAVRCHVADAADHHLGSVECWVVGPEGWYGLDCADPRCCPPGGRPLAELQSTEIGAHMVLTGATVQPSRAGLATIPPADAAARRSTRRAAVRWAERAVLATAEDLPTWRRRGLALWRAELAAALAAVGKDAEPDVPVTTPLGGHGREPATLGRLQAALADVLVRDAVLIGFVPGNDRVADRVVAGDPGADVAAALRAIIDPVDGVPPEPALVRASAALLRDVVAHSSRAGGAPARTLLAVLAWWQGDGVRAGALVDAALAAAPGHRLALLLAETLEAGMPPGWLRHPVDRAEPT